MADIFDIFKRLEQNKTAPSATPITHLLVGLGNPGKEYERTRHNAGWRAIDILADKLGCKIDKGKFQGLYGQTTYSGTKLYLLKL